MAILAGAGLAPAADIPLPPVNLGDTSFQDGIGFPGWVAEETIGYYHAGHFNDHRGEKIPGSNSLTTVSATTHLAFITHLRLLGGFYGAEVILPVAHLDIDTSFGPSEQHGGFGDLAVSPLILQWSDHTIFGRPYFHRLDFVVTLPTGEYHRSRPVNIGNNLVSVNPYYAFTLVAAAKLEVSARLHYLWNSENAEPFRGLRATSIQPGQAFHANYAASYELFEGLRLGVNGYVLQQISADKIDGRGQPNSEERVVGIGPGMQWTIYGLSAYVNSYVETAAKNRPEGVKVLFRLSKTF